jgi:hypothetical protein
MNLPNKSCHNSCFSINKIFQIIAITLLLTGCAPGLTNKITPSQTTQISSVSPEPSPQPSSTATFTQEPTSTTIPSQTPSPIPTAQPRQNSQYLISAEFSYDQHRISVDEQIIYVNNTSVPLPDLVIIVDSNRYPGAFKLNNLIWKEDQKISGYTWEGNTLLIELSQPLEPLESVSLFLSYDLRLPDASRSSAYRPIPFGYTDRQMNLTEWYPFVPAYKPGAGWLAHPAGYYGEHLVYDIADFDIQLKLLDDHQDLVIAASAPADIEGDIYHYKHDSARNFVLSISHKYQVRTQVVGDVTVLSYFFPFHDSAGETVLRTTVEAVSLYSNLFGPYTHKTLSAVEADFNDGMEYDGLYFLSSSFYNQHSNRPGEYLVSIAAHETAHQWWYRLVSNDQALEPWLDEALSTYSERLFYEYNYPDALSWWWDYRINYYQPGGWVDRDIYQASNVVNVYRIYRDAVYLNGALFLEELRQLVGDETFFSFLRNYANKYSYGFASADDFFDTLGQHTQVNTSLLLEKYFLKR